MRQAGREDDDRGRDSHGGEDDRGSATPLDLVRPDIARPRPVGPGVRDAHTLDHPPIVARLARLRPSASARLGRDDGARPERTLDSDPMRIPRSPAAAAVSALLAVAALLTLPSIALGHAELLSAQPADGAVLTTPPTTVTLSFDDELTDVSSVELRSAAGATIATGGRAPDDAKTLKATFAPLAPGDYMVRWTAGTADGHVERGTFGFTVVASTAAPSPTALPATAAPSTPPGPTAAPSPTPSGDSGSPGAASGADVLLPILAAVVVVGAGLLLLRRRSAS